MAKTPTGPSLPSIPPQSRPTPWIKGEATGAQTIYVIAGINELSHYMPATYATYRTMRKHPTIALARSLSIAPVVAADWSVEADEGVPDEVAKFISDQFMPIREPLIEQAMLGGVDFGWQPYEKVFEFTNSTWRIRKFKPLLQDNTIILVNKDTGAFDGFKQDDVTLKVEKCLLVSFRVEGSDWYGQALLENVRATYNDWKDANDGAARYDNKMAGTHFVIYYPIGKTKRSGIETDNKEIAEEIATAIKSSSTISLPRTIAKYIEDLNDKAYEQTQWKIEMMGDPAGRYTFTPRLEYLDKLLVRGLLFPERAMLEGKFGTKADAGEHGDLALTHMDLVHRNVTRHVNWYAVDPLVAFNFGEELRGKARLVAAPLVDEKITFFRKIYERFLTNPGTLLAEYASMDLTSLKAALGVPRSIETFAAGEDIETLIPILAQYAGRFNPTRDANGQGIIAGRLNE